MRIRHVRQHKASWIENYFRETTELFSLQNFVKVAISTGEISHTSKSTVAEWICDVILFLLIQWIRFSWGNDSFTHKIESAERMI